MTRWVRSFLDWEGIPFAFCREVSNEGWVTRQVQLVGDDLRPIVATSLDDMNEMDAEAIQQYEARYGPLIEQRITRWDFPHEDVSQAEFEAIWRAARAALESRR